MTKAHNVTKNKCKNNIKAHSKYQYIISMNKQKWEMLLWQLMEASVSWSTKIAK